MGGIVWLASYPKSGNTWARIFLANLIVNGERPININDISRYIAAENDLVFIQDSSGKMPSTLSDKEINRLRPAAHKLVCESHPGPQFLKTHSTFAVLDGVPTITPECSHAAIYFVRNPLDVAVSYAHHSSWALAKAVDFLEDAGARTPTDEQHAFQFLGTWSKHVEAWTTTKALRVHVTRYEDMVLEPVRAFGSICRFLGMPVQQPHLERAITFSSFDVLSGQEAEVGFREQLNTSTRFFRKGRIGSWREELSADLADRIVARHGQVMQRFGYLDDDGQPVF